MATLLMGKCYFWYFALQRSDVISPRWRHPEKDEVFSSNLIIGVCNYIIKSNQIK
jgi:hypothetical protein